MYSCFHLVQKLKELPFWTDGGLQQKIEFLALHAINMYSCFYLVQKLKELPFWIDGGLQQKIEFLALHAINK